MNWRNDRAKIEALEALPEIGDDPSRGRMVWAGIDGEIREYVGPLRSLGDGIPRTRSRNPIRYRVQRAAWHLALGYASGFPVRDVLAFTARNFWPIVDVRGLEPAVVEPVRVAPRYSEQVARARAEYAAGGIVGRAFGVPPWVEAELDELEEYIPLRTTSARNRRIIAETLRRLGEAGSGA